MSRVYVLVRAGRRPAAAQTILRWIRALVPAAILLTSPNALPQGPDEDDDDALVIQVDADDVSSGPLALAAAIARGVAARTGGGAPPDREK